jgi:hypothetical protein
MLDLNDSIMSGIYCLKVYPGNFYDKEPVVKEISSTNDLNPKQKDAIRNIRTVSSLEHDGFELKVKIPLDLIDTNTISSNGEHPVKIGFDLVYFDIDNQFRPEEVTVIATSVFDESNPYSYGELLIMPNEQWYGYSVNIYKDDVVKALNGDGF